ncbi:hypothetical protein QVD17_35432 [Tagetes erecta]|uniref:CCT domain-containing protein n=1 Tax=Tagetes erecta TaxID=13708 RepID=A0AAD8NMD7_TARER|nr:hypothetical protein QVD17_35432 [Tagetes erecta]
MNYHHTTFVKTFHFLKEQVSSPLSAQLLEFCESDLFQETMENPEVASSSNHCHEEESTYAIDPSIPPYMNECLTLVDNNGTTSTTATTTTTVSATAINDFSLMFEDEITQPDLANISNFTNNQYTFSNQDQFDLSSLQNQNRINDPVFPYPHALPNDHGVPVIRPTTLLNTCEEDIIPPMSPSKFMLSNHTLSANYPFLGPSISSHLTASTEAESLFLGNDIQLHEHEFHGDSNSNGIFCTNNLQHSFNSNDLQAFSTESQHFVNGGVSSTTTLASEIASLESESLRVTNKLTSEERKEKINKYMKKRNERNFNKKIKYACRKTLADSRPRVRGRFAKHDEFGENNITNSNHEEDTDEDEQNFNEMMKDEEDRFESSDLLAHMSGVHSFKCNYSIQSWI